MFIKHATNLLVVLAATQEVHGLYMGSENTLAPRTSKTSSTSSTSCAPGGTFDLSKWSLQLPIGTTGHPTTIKAAQLITCKGYSNPDFFFTEKSDGALVMKVPGSTASSGCVTTSGSKHCRTELRETDPASWDPSKPVNKLTVNLTVITPDDGTHGTVIGQVFNAEASKPVAELFYDKFGQIRIGVEQTAAGGDEVVTKIAKVAVGTKFTYVLAYENKALTVSINGAEPVSLDTFSLDGPMSYFKAGNYDQGSIASEVRFFSIATEHA